jgi:catechol 2,3-dioxygenase-like lactoylglutathione lyase family enzyme
MARALLRATGRCSPCWLRTELPLTDAKAIGNGAQSEGEPGLRPHYHADYYGAYFRDPDGNKLCICCHDPATL